MFLRYFLSVALFIVFSTAVQASEWVVERATQGVSVSADGKTWRSLQTGDSITNGHWVRTGTRARAILAKGSERIVFRGDTFAAVSVSQPSGKKTRITQQKGSILLSVKKRRTQHTSVVTPHLAAVVKGTVFEVSVSRSNSSVRVDEGKVEVSGGDGSQIVTPGQRAKVGGKSKSVKVARARVTSITSRGTVGLELAEIASEGKSNAGGNGNGNDGRQPGNAGAMAMATRAAATRVAMTMINPDVTLS